MKWAPVGCEARIAPPTLAPFVTLSVVGESLTTSVARDYNLWVYIITNEHDSVLYVGMTNDLAYRSPSIVPERFQVSPPITAVRN
jgi:GIY-YIG catalytic domain